MAPKRASPAKKKAPSPAPATRRSTRATAPSARAAAGEKPVSPGKVAKKSPARGAKTTATKPTPPRRTTRKSPAKASKTAAAEKTAPVKKSSPPKRGRPAKKVASSKKGSPAKVGRPAKKAASTEAEKHYGAPPQADKPCAVQVGENAFEILDREPYSDELPREKATRIVEDLIAQFKDPKRSMDAAENHLLHAAYYVLRSALFGGGRYCKAAKAPAKELRKLFEDALSKEESVHGHNLVEVVIAEREGRPSFDEASGRALFQDGLPQRPLPWQERTFDYMRPLEEELKAVQDGKTGPPLLKQLKTFFDRLKAAQYGMAYSASKDVDRQVALWNEVTGEDFAAIFAGEHKAELALWKRVQKLLAEWPAEGVKQSIEDRGRKAVKGKVDTAAGRSKSPAKAAGNRSTKSPSKSPTRTPTKSPTKSSSKSPVATRSPRRSASPAKSMRKTSAGVGRDLWDPDQGFEKLHPPKTRGAGTTQTSTKTQHTATRSPSNVSVSRTTDLARRGRSKSPARAQRASQSPARSQSPAATAAPSKAVNPPRTAASTQRALRKIGTAEEQRMRDGYEDRLVRLPACRKFSGGRATSLGDTDRAAPPSSKRKRAPSPNKRTRSQSPAKIGRRPSAQSDSSRRSHSPAKKKSRKATVRDAEEEQAYDWINGQLVPVDPDEPVPPLSAKKPQSPRKHGIKGGFNPGKRIRTSSFGEDFSERGNMESFVNRRKICDINGKPTEMDNPFFEKMPAPEVWHRRMPNVFPFGETPFMERVVSNQIVEDLARSNDQDAPLQSERQKDMSPARRASMMDSFRSYAGKIFGSLSPIRGSAAPATEPTAKTSSRPAAPPPWILPKVSEDEVKTAMGGMKAIGKAKAHHGHRVGRTPSRSSGQQYMMSGGS